MKVMITGGSSGIGLATASKLHNEGHDVVVVSRSAPPAGTHRSWIKADLSDLSSIDAVAYEAGALDALIHCAGACQRSAVANTEPASIQAMFNLNAIAPILLTRALTPALSDRLGCVVGVSSLAGRIGSPGNSVYSSTKFALDGYLESVAYELAHVGVRTRVIIPLYANTPFMRSAAALESAPAAPYTDFEAAARARFDASLQDAPLNATQELADVIADAALTPGAAWFDRLVVGGNNVLKQHHSLGPSLWFEHFSAQLHGWFPPAS